MQLFPFLWLGHVSWCLNWIGSSLTPCHDITFPRKEILVHLNRHTLSLRFNCLHYICSIFSSISSWSLPCSSNPAIKMSSAMPRSFNMPLNRSFVIFWNMSLAGAVPNGSLTYQYLPNGLEMLVSIISF